MRAAEFDADAPRAALCEVLLDDRFDLDTPPGTVIGSQATSGAERLGVDREGTLSIDHGRLRMGWLAHGGWGRSAIAYGPIEQVDGTVLVVDALNALTTSQTDPRREGGRAALQRIRDTFPRASLRRPALRQSLTIGWFTAPVATRETRPIAAFFYRAGTDATGELWCQVGGQRVRLARDLQNLPAVYAISISDQLVSFHAWSHPGAHGFSAGDDLEPLAELALTDVLPPEAFAVVQQPIFGEVRYRVDTRVSSVRVVRAPSIGSAVDLPAVRRGWWEPVGGEPATVDDFDGEAGDLHDTADESVGSRSSSWRRVLGDGVIERTGSGEARVRATVAVPNPGRTVYCVPWHDPSGVEVGATVVPPGTRRGEGHQGRSGLVIWQDADNHLVINHFLDDGSVGVSISAFLRTGGQEEMFEWDAVWSNVAQRVGWGKPFDLSVSCDGHQFLCRIAGEPVLYRRLTDYRQDAAPLRIAGVGLAANWEWGDDTGTVFRSFSARPLDRAVHGAHRHPPEGPSQRPTR